MAKSLTALHTVFTSYLRKRKSFADRPALRVVVHTGVLRIDNESDLGRVLNFRYPFDRQGFDTEVTELPTEQGAGLQQCRRLFGESFAAAMKLVLFT